MLTLRPLNMGQEPRSTVVNWITLSHIAWCLVFFILYVTFYQVDFLEGSSDDTCNKIHFTSTKSQICLAFICIACSKGTYGKDGQCLPCPAGQYNDGSKQWCSFCPPGRYNNKTGSSSCRRCPKGTYNTLHGQTTLGKT